MTAIFSSQEHKTDVIIKKWRFSKGGGMNKKA